jgi:hypothetical protein
MLTLRSLFSFFLCSEIGVKETNFMNGSGGKRREIFFFPNKKADSTAYAT